MNSKITPIILFAMAIFSSIGVAYAEGDSIQINNLFLTILSSVYFWVTACATIVLCYNSKRHWDFKILKETRRTLLKK